MPYTIKDLEMPGLAIHSRKVSLSIADKIREYGGPYDVATVAYLFYKLLESGDSRLNSPYSLEETANMQFERFKSGEVVLNPYILNNLGENIKHSFIKAYKVYEDVGDNADIYAALIVFDSYSGLKNNRYASEMTTPNSIADLARAILDIKNSDMVADICCGNGNFITRCIGDNKCASYTGYEININCVSLLAMKADILGVDPTIVMGDIEYTLSDKNAKFDKIFSNYPLGMRIEEYDQKVHTMPFWISRNSSDWYFNNIVIEHLSQTGKAVTISGVGSTWNMANKEARKYFIENGYIEAVINLPANLMSMSAIPVVLYVFSHGNKNVRFIDAEKIIDNKFGGIHSLSGEDIDEILKLLENDSERSILVSKESIAEKDYSLAFRSYKSDLPSYENGTPISEVAEIIRGVINPKDALTNKYTGKYLLQISDLENGIIKKDLDTNRQIDVEKCSYEQRLLPYDIIITRSAQPIKIAIVSANEKRELYPNGNMFVIRVKSLNVNPYYLLSFLLSKDGQEALNYATTGSSLKIISSASLMELVFPLKSSHEQRIIAEDISTAIARYEAYSLKADIAKNDIENSYYGKED